MFSQATLKEAELCFIRYLVTLWVQNF